MWRDLILIHVFLCDYTNMQLSVIWLAATPCRTSFSPCLLLCIYIYPFHSEKSTGSSSPRENPDPVANEASNVAFGNRQQEPSFLGDSATPSRACGGLAWAGSRPVCVRCACGTGRDAMPRGTAQCGRQGHIPAVTVFGWGLYRINSILMNKSNLATEFIRRYTVLILRING